MSAPLRLVSICALVPLAACLGPEEWPQTIGWQPTIGACLVPLAGWEQPPEDMLEYEGPIHVVLSITAAGEDDPPEAFDCWSSIPGGLWSPPPNEPSRWVLGVDAAGAGWEVIIAEPSNLPIGRSGEVLDVTYAATLLAADGPLGRGSFVAENLSSGLSVHLLMGADSSGVAPPAPVTFSDGVSLATHRVWCGCWEERALDVSAPDRAFTLLRGESGWAGGWLVTHGGFDQPVVDGAGCRGSPAWECVHVEGEFALQAAVVGPARRQLRLSTTYRRKPGSEGGAEVAATAYTLVGSCMLQGIDPFDYLVDVLGRIQDHSARRLGELTPRSWRLAKQGLTFVRLAETDPGVFRLHSVS